MKPSQVHRILDANFNRCREGLRVCEDVARFVLDAKTLSAALKKDRHAVSAVWKRLFAKDRSLLSSRDTAKDVGRRASEKAQGRASFRELYWANSQRAKEALRALEETVKLLEPGLAATFKRIRFHVYALEKRALPRLEALCDHDAGSRVGRKGTSGHPRRRGRGTASR